MPHFTPLVSPGPTMPCKQMKSGRITVSRRKWSVARSCLRSTPQTPKKNLLWFSFFNSWLRLSPPLKKNTHDTSAQNPGWNPKKYGRTMTQNKVPPWRFVHGYHNGPFRCPHGGGNMANHSNSRNTITVPVAENKLTQSGKYQKEEFYRKHKICVWGKSFELP